MDVSHAPERQPRSPSLALATIIAIVVSTVLNLAIRGITLVGVDVDDRFLPLQLGPVLFLSVVSALGGGLLLAALIRWTRRPRRTFLLAAGIVFILSMLPVVGVILGDDEDPQFGGAPWLVMVALGAMHVVSALVVVGTLLRSSSTEQ